MALVLRYRQGTRVDIDASPFDALREFLSHRTDPGFPLATLNETIHEEFWDQWTRPDAASTWFAILREFFQIHPEKARSTAWPAQLRILDALVLGGSTKQIWERVLASVLLDLEQLAGWDHSVARAAAMLWPVERAADGKCYHDEDSERVEVIGGRTMLEAKLEYLIEDAVRQYGHVGQICRFVALLCAYASFAEDEASFPQTIRITLNEDSYLQWSWYSLSPIGVRRVPWRPSDRHSEPESLGIEIAARYEERHSIDTPARAPEHPIPHHEFPRQYELALDTDLRIGDNDEALLRYRDREIRWINGTRGYCAILIIGVHNDDAFADRQFVEEFLSVVAFETHIPVVPMMSLIGARKHAPTVMQPRKLADHIYPSGWRFGIERAMSKERRLALALYREGISSRSAYYQFFSLYKILHIRLRGNRVDGWIKDHANDNVPSTTRIAQLRSEGVSNLGRYLKRDWRDAIAHVEHKSRVNPDDLNTRTRIYQDLPIVRDLATTMIRSELFD
jgi:methylamine utilization protein MauJ